MSAWPIVRIATVSGTPAARSNVAAPWRRPWNMIPANPCSSPSPFTCPENVAGWNGSTDRVRHDELGRGARGEEPLALRHPVALQRLSDERRHRQITAPRPPTSVARSGTRLRRGERPADVHGLVDVRPPEPEHLLAPQPEAERQVNGRIPRVRTRPPPEDPGHRASASITAKLEALADRAVHESGAAGFRPISPRASARLRGLREHPEDVGNGLRGEPVGQERVTHLFDVEGRSRDTEPADDPGAWRHASRYRWRVVGARARPRLDTRHGGEPLLQEVALERLATVGKRPCVCSEHGG